jgi:hypothetical protein
VSGMCAGSEDKERQGNDKRKKETKWREIVDKKECVGHQLLPAHLSVRAPAVLVYYYRTKSMVRRLY